jgi:cytochrome b subunit of formate dehydrogenase
MNREARNTMFDDGYLPSDYVKNHHQNWYEKLCKKKIVNKIIKDVLWKLIEERYTQ